MRIYSRLTVTIVTLGLLLVGSRVAADPEFAAPIVNPFGIQFADLNQCPTLADIDGDGDLDLITGSGLGTGYLLRNTGSIHSPQFGTAAKILPDVENLIIPRFLDIEGDGDLDAMVGDIYVLHLFPNVGDNTQAAFGPDLVSPFGISTGVMDLRPSFGDLDSDGDFDVIVTDFNQKFHFFRNTGNSTNPAFGSQETSPFGLKPNTIYWPIPQLIDLDEDGDLDLFCTTGQTDDFAFFRNTGTPVNPAFAPPVFNPFGLSSVGDWTTAALGDLDGDHDYDLLAVNNNSSTFLFFENTSVDNAAPASSCTLVMPAIDPHSVDLEFQSADPLTAFTSGVGSTELFVKGPGSSSYISTGQQLVGTEGTFHYEFASGAGTYKFYTVATDRRGNVEAAPHTPDDSIVLVDAAPTIIGGLVSLDPFESDHDTISFQVTLSEPVTPALDFELIEVAGSLAPGASIAMNEGADPLHRTISVRLADPNASGTLGIAINGVLKDTVGNLLAVPITSSLHTILNHPPGDVNKSGTFDLADVALLSDANLGLATLP